MPLPYKFLTQAEQDDAVLAAIMQREREHFHYELNRANYEEILAGPVMTALPDNWPANLERFKGLTGEALAAALTDPTDYEVVSNLKLRDRLRLLLATTKTETATVEHVRVALDTVLPAGTRLDEAKTRHDEKKAAAAAAAEVLAK